MSDGSTYLFEFVSLLLLVALRLGDEGGKAAFSLRSRFGESGAGCSDLCRPRRPDPTVGIQDPSQTDLREKGFSEAHDSDERCLP
jgi:hypothetical protein